MGSLEETLYELYRAMKSGDQKKEEAILKTLYRVGMDPATAKLLIGEYQKEWDNHGN